jgi:hypothetical protein
MPRDALDQRDNVANGYRQADVTLGRRRISSDEIGLPTVWCPTWMEKPPLRFGAVLRKSRQAPLGRIWPLAGESQVGLRIPETQRPPVLGPKSPQIVHSRSLDGTVGAAFQAAGRPDYYRFGASFDCAPMTDMGAKARPPGGAECPVPGSRNQPPSIWLGLGPILLFRAVLRRSASGSGWSGVTQIRTYRSGNRGAISVHASLLSCRSGTTANGKARPVQDPARSPGVRDM